MAHRDVSFPVHLSRIPFFRWDLCWPISVSHEWILFVARCRRSTLSAPASLRRWIAVPT
jgi:hypothetical protein